jgi:hypothetical protein
VVRVRPLNEREKQEDSKFCVKPNETEPNTLLLDSKPESKLFRFDWVGDSNTTQESIFLNIGRPLLLTCFEGKQSLTTTDVLTIVN